MIRSIASAIIASAALLASTGASAQTATGFYVATPVAAPAKARLMTRSTPWRLMNGTYVAAQAPEREMTLCQLVARDVGQLSAFSAGGKAFDAASMDKCNAKAPVVQTSIAKAPGGEAAATN
jgi:hypothetical protein